VNHELQLQRGELPSAIDFLRERLLPGAGRRASPGLGSILVKAVMLSSVQRTRELAGTLDLLLRPEPAEIGFLEWTAIDRGIELGYRYAKRELARRDVSRWVDAGAAPAP
jgi:hypothetical protein